MEERVADYLVVAGLPESDPVPLEEFSPAGPAPITDIAVINRSQGEAVPHGYVCIETTKSGNAADLNHGSLRSPSMFLCYRRGRDKPPLVDIGVLFEGKERLMADSKVVLTTPYGRTANVNNSTSSRTFLTYRRSSPNAVCNQLVVTDICVILHNKGEPPPRAFCIISRNLNKGLVGSDVYICYKKSMNKPPLLCFQPGLLGRVPQENSLGFPLPSQVALFCLPMGATVECWPPTAAHPAPQFSTFVLTSDAAQKVYGAAVTFYESYPGPLTCQDLGGPRDGTLHSNKAICLLSRWPFYDTFERFLMFLQRAATSGEPHPVPLERYISYLMLDVPFPSPQRPRILVQLTAEDTISLAQPEDSPLPLSGASFVQLLRNLGADNCIQVLLFALTEQKILFHSLRTDVLTRVAEAVVSIMFPFHWQCPYIPLCPLGLSDVLNAPLPFIVGVDSRYFDLYEPPPEVICVDLDTNSIFLSEEKRWLTPKILPKRAVRALRSTLFQLYEKLYLLTSANHVKNLPLDHDFKKLRKEHQMELEIQEAFLRFMASVLRDFHSYLRPITQAPTVTATDASSLFDLQGFLKSRDRAYQRFYSLLLRTQMFMRLIEERSFVSANDVSLAFFDECIKRAEENSTGRWLGDPGDHQNDRTVFLPPPEPTGLTYSYTELGALNLSLLPDRLQPGLGPPPPSSPLARRTKLEIKSAQRIARKQSKTPMMWAKCLVGYCFSLWFIHLPSYVQTFGPNSKWRPLRTAFQVLVHMQKLRLLPQDEVSYRVLMLLCGQYSQPMLAVKVLFEMRNHGVQPNAITYGYYNKAVLESTWPSGDTTGKLLWNKLRNVVMGVAQFRRGGSASISREGSDELLTETRPLKIDDRHSSGGLSDAGYSSLNQEESKKIAECLCAEHHKPTQLKELDFSASDAFRSRVGSIVKSSASSLSQLHDTTVDSPAGLLMTSQRFLDGSEHICFPNQRRRHHSMGEKLARDDHAPFLRSKSFAEDDQILIKLDSEQPRSRSPNIPIRSQSLMKPEDSLVEEEEDEEASDSLNSRGRDFLYSTLSPLRDAWQSWDLSSLAASFGSSFTPPSRVSRSSTFHARQSRRASTACIEEPRLSRSSTLPPVTPPRASLADLLRNRNAEVLMEGLRSATSSLANKFRQSISATNTPTKGNSNSLPPRTLPPTAPDSAIDTDDQASTASEQRPADLFGEEEVEFDHCFKEDDKTGNNVPLFSSQNLDMDEPAATTEPTGSDLEVLMTTVSRCLNCNSLLYDEDIMEGWTADDSNLNTSCRHCSHSLVPLLNIVVREHVPPPPPISRSIDSGSEAFILLEDSSPVLDHPLAQDSSKPQSTNPIEETSNSVPYLSPLVLRKEVENILDQEGDGALAQASFVDAHPIVYWNLVWFFRRINVPSHLPSLCLQASSVCRRTQPPGSSVVVRCLWDLPKLHEDLGRPLYSLWHSSIDSTPLVDALLAEDQLPASKQLMKQILGHIQSNDLRSPIQMLLGERSKVWPPRQQGPAARHHRSLYRELLFLSMVVLGRSSIDQLAFDIEFQRACAGLESPAHQAALLPADRPPTPAATFCRRFFRELELLV